MSDPRSMEEKERVRFPEQLLNCLSFDLEIDGQSRLTAQAARRADTGEESTFRTTMRGGPITCIALTG